MEGGTTMTSFISFVTEFFTAILGYVVEVASTVVETPILLFFCLLPIVGIGVGMFKRLIHIN